VHRRSDRGAAAVEFALVLPVLLLLLFGIIEYGIYFSDQISTRHGAASGARMAAIRLADSTTPSVPADSTTPSVPADSTTPSVPADCTAWEESSSPKIKEIGCAVVAGTRPLTGKVYVRITVLPPTSSAVTTPNAVRVCLLQVHDSVTGLIPLPNEVITARVDMPVEPVEGTSTVQEGEQVLPEGMSWEQWCP
jgi:hypothetical protein